MEVITAYLKVLSLICLEKMKEISLMIPSNFAETGTVYLLNTCPEHNCYTTQFGQRTLKKKEYYGKN
jgi:hypothetical protein